MIIVGTMSEQGTKSHRYMLKANFRNNDFGTPSHVIMPKENKLIIDKYLKDHRNVLTGMRNRQI